MKFRTFISTFCLFNLVYYVSLFLISFFILHTQIDTAKQQAETSHYLLASSFGKDIEAIKNRNENAEPAIDSLFQYYMSYYKQKGMYIEIYQDQKVLHSSFSIEHNTLNNISYPDSGYRNISIKSIGGKEFVSIIGEIPETENEYYLYYLYDITDNLSEWENMQKIIVMIGILFSLFLAIILQVLLNRVFKPLNMVSSASKQIADGQYENRIAISGNHELADMAKNFNTMADEIQKKITMLTEATEQKQQFVDNFSHEIRTPMTSIFGYAEYFAKVSMDEEERMKIANYIMSESKHILTISDHMLEIASFQNHEIIKHEIDIETLLRSLKSTMLGKLEQKKIQLHWECEMTVVYGDFDLLENLLINLLDNSIKASKENSKIDCKAVIEGNNRVISVTDYGKGMTKEQLAHITEPFYRVDKSRSRTDGGAGLGLAICEKIAACHHARLEFTSEYGIGTTAKLIFTGLQ